MPHRILEPCEGAVVEKGRLQRNVADRRSPKPITVIRVASYLLQPKILVLTGPVERRMAGERLYLRSSAYMLTKVAEHFVGGPRNFLAVNTPGLAKEEQRCSLFVVGQGAHLSPRKLVYWRIGKD